MAKKIFGAIPAAARLLTGSKRKQAVADAAAAPASGPIVTPLGGDAPVVPDVFGKRNRRSARSSTVFDNSLSDRLGG